MRVVLTGGGTGGHMTPLIAVTRMLRRIAEAGLLPILDTDEPDLEVLYVGVVTDADRQSLEGAGIPFVPVPSGKIRRYLSGTPLTVFDLLFRLPVGMLRGLWQLFFLMPDVVFSKGGYGSIPTVTAAWVYRIPVLLHETDLVPGVANRWLARLASAIAVGFREAERAFPARKVFVAGTPLRPEFEALPSVEGARDFLRVRGEKPLLFVTGGSQGSQRMNTALLAILPELLPEAEIVHQVGEKNSPAIREFVERDLRQLPDVAEYHPVGSLTAAEMAAAYVAADLVVGRAGGTTIAEITAVGRPSLLIPLKEAAQQHQWENAYFLREQGAAAVLDESNLTPAIFRATLHRLLRNPQDLKLMADRVRKLRVPRSAETIAQTLVDMAQGRIPRRETAAPRAGTAA